jgi:hypothetical protein
MNKIYILLILFPMSLFAQNQTLLHEDFEGGLSGWTAINLVDAAAPTLWRITNTRYVSPGHSAAWNDSASNTYPGGRYEALESPPVTIPHNGRTFLKFKAFIHLTLNGTYYHDYFHIKYTTNNGNTWNNFLPYAQSGQQLVWRSFPEDFGPTAYNELTYHAGKTMKFRIITHSDTLNPNGLGVFLDDFIIYTQQCDFVDLNEPNNSTSTATEVSLGDIIQASLCPQNDEDFYKFTAQQGDQLTLVTQHTMNYTYLYFLNSNGNTLVYAYNEMTYNVTTTGTYYLRVTGSYNYSANYSVYFNSRPEPDIIAVTDIPEDQGLQVRVKWQASFYDPQFGTGKVKEYQLWRKINDTTFIGSAGSRIKAEGNSYTSSLLNDYWEYIATIPALSNRPFLNYSYVAPTLEDNILTTFIIAAIPKTDTQPVEWGSEGSGFSVDNLSPELINYTVSNSVNGIKLNWNINSAHPDVERIEIFKGIYEIFPPVQENRIADLDASEYTYLDDDLLGGFSYYYIISLTDRSGNRSYSPALSAGYFTSVEKENNYPKEMSLKQNYPNPFNPSTTIEFSLVSVTNISLRIYDSIGREIRELAGGSYTPGNYKIEFNAAELPSGIYFYTLNAGSFSETRKLILLK